MVGACQGGVVVANDARWKLVAMSTQNFRPGQWEYMGFVGVLKVESFPYVVCSDLVGG